MKMSFINKKMSFKRLLLLTLALVSFAVVGLFSYSLRDFYSHLDNLTASIGNKDTDNIREELEYLRRYTGESQNNYLTRSLVKRYMLKDFYLYEASYYYLIGDYDRVVRDLGDRIDDPEALNLVGCAKFMTLHASYALIDNNADDAEEKKIEIVRTVLESVNPDFAAAVRESDNPPFSHRFNYDLTIDPDKIMLALEGRKPQIQFILGYDGDGLSMRPGDEGEIGFDEEKEGDKAGEGGSKKVG